MKMNEKKKLNLKKGKWIPQEMYFPLNHLDDQNAYFFTYTIYSKVYVLKNV